MKLDDLVFSWIFGIAGAVGGIVYTGMIASPENPQDMRYVLGGMAVGTIVGFCLDCCNKGFGYQRYNDDQRYKKEEGIIDIKLKQDDENKLIRLKSEELEKIFGITTLGTIKIRALQYLTSNVDEVREAISHHRERIEENILTETKYKQQFEGIDAYCLSEAKEEFVQGGSYAVSEYEVTCYRMTDGAYCKIPGMNNE